MITCITGRGRSGKTYEAVRYHIIEALKKGRKVITNVPLNITHFKAVLGDEVETLIDVREYNFSDYGNERPFSRPDCYIDDWRDSDNKGPLYVIDEAHLSLKRGKTRDEVKEFYTMHGHRGIDITLLTQNLRQMDIDITNLIDIVIKCTKNRALGSDSTYTRKVQDGYRGAVVNEDQRRYQAAYFKFYKSHTASNGSVNEASASDVKPIWSHWSFKGAVLFLPIGIYFVASTIGSVLSPSPSKPEKPDPTPIEAQAPDVREVPNRREPVLPSKPTQQQPKVKTLEQQYAEAVATAPPPIKDIAYHPFKKVELSITGNSQYTLRGREVSDVYFSASRGGYHVFELNLKDLYMAGYEVTVLGDCLVRLSYQDYSDHIVCAPKGKRVNDVLREANPLDNLISDDSNIEIASK